MTDNQFDEFFKNKLGKYASGVPDDMWQRINKKDKDRKGFFIPRWYMLAFLLLLAGPASVYVFFYKDNKDGITKNVAPSLMDTSAKNENNKNKLQTNKTETQNNIVEKPGNEKINKPFGGSNKSAKKVETNFINSGTTEIENQQTNDGVNDIDIAGNEATAGKQFDNKNDESKKTVATDKSKEKDSTRLASEEESKKTTDDESINDKFSIEFYASPDLPFNSISSDNYSYEQTLKDAGKMQLSYSVGARLGIRINKSWAAKIGVLYSQVNEKMNFVDSILSGGNVSYKNRYKSIDIPLLLVYKKKWSESFNTSVNAGILLNITSKYKGVIPGPSGDAMHIDNTNIYKSNTGVNIFLGVDLSKQLNNRTDIFTEPYFRYRIKSITTNMQSFDQKINAIGISFGVRYRLFKKRDE